MKTVIKKFFLEEDGASAVEYALLIGLIAVAIISGAKLLGTNLNTNFSTTASSVGS